MCSYLVGFKRKFEVLMTEVMDREKKTKCAKYDYPLVKPAKQNPLPLIPLPTEFQSSYRKNRPSTERDIKMKKSNFNKGDQNPSSWRNWFDRHTPESSFRITEKEEYMKLLKAYNKNAEVKANSSSSSNGPDLFTRLNKIKSTIPSSSMHLKRESLSSENLNSIRESFEIKDISQETIKNNSLAKEQKAFIFLDQNFQNKRKAEYNKRQDFLRRDLAEEIKTFENLKLTTTQRDREEHLKSRITFTGILEIEPEPEIIKLSEEMENYIDRLNLMGGSRNQKIVTVFRIDVLRGDLLTLLPGRWLNDNVMNVYFELLGARDGFVKSYVFSTFFYPKYVKEGYSNALKRWTRKIDVFAFELLLFPIHLGVHWTLAAADFKLKTIKYYDSLGSPNSKCLKLLMEYLCREFKEKKGIDFPVNEWKLENVIDIPQQQNGCDCGMFTCKFAEYLSRGKSFTFSQEHMDLFRRRMIYEICHEKLIYP